MIALRDLPPGIPRPARTRAAGPDRGCFDLDHVLIDTDRKWAWKNMPADMKLVRNSQRSVSQDWVAAIAAESMPKIYALGARA